MSCHQLVSTHFGTSIIPNKTKTVEKHVLFLTSHSDVLKKAQSILKFISNLLILFHPVSCFLSDAVCANPLPFFSPLSLYFFHFISVCLCLFFPFMLPCYPLYFLSLLSALCSVRFLISFPNVSIRFYWLSSVARCESWTTVILFTPPVGGVWLGPHLISVICTCIPQGKGCACIPDSACLHSYKGCVFFSLSVSAV